MSEETGLIAVQGPHAERLVGRLSDVDVPAIGYYHFRRGRVAGVPGIISRTGYTGEDGFELYLPAAEHRDGLGAAPGRGEARRRGAHRPRRPGHARGSR